MTPVSFEVSADDGALISRIALRAARWARDHGGFWSVLDASMDVTAAHANGCPLRLADLLDADDSNFAHDVFGIRRYIDRNTGHIVGGFWPRFAAPAHAEGGAA